MKLFWDKVDKSGDCWQWTAGTNALGYGSFNFRGKPKLAHRVALELLGRKPHKDICVLHHCDNPGCVNPDHLFLGTRSDNNKDRHDKGRSSGGSNRGETNPMSVLCELDVWLIRELRGSHQSIADWIGVSQTVVSGIKRRATWSHI